MSPNLEAQGEATMIYCDRCGTENPDQAQRCTSCGAPLARLPMAPPVPDSAGTVGRSAIVSVILGAISLVYLLNPTAGVIELLPDNLPLVGNLDEGVAGMLLLQALYNLRQLISRKGGAGRTRP